MKKNITFAIALIILLNFSGFRGKAYAKEEKINLNNIYYRTVSEKEVESNFQKKINEVLEVLNNVAVSYPKHILDIEPMDRSYYSSEVVAIKEGQSDFGWAGGQPRDGYEFPYGGSMSWTDGTSPSLNVSVAINHELVSFSVGLGTGTLSGVSTANPNVPGPGWWKMKVARTFQVRVVNIYKHSSNGQKTLYMTMTPHEITGVRFEFVRTR